MDELKDKSDHDLLIELRVEVRELIKGHNNHLAHHWRITLLALTAGIIGATNLFIGLILVLVKGL